MSRSAERVHFVAHSHGGNVLLKALFLCEGKLDPEKIGKLVFLGTPFFSYKSLNPKRGVWKRLQQTAKQQGRSNFDDVTIIRSRYDEAYVLLKQALEIRAKAYELSLQLSSSKRDPSSISPSAMLSPYVMHRMRRGRFNATGIRGHAFSQSRSGTRPRIFYGYFTVLGMLPGFMLSVFGSGFLEILSPFASRIKSYLQRWGVYFGMRSLASNALGDDLAFEGILSVDVEPEHCSAPIVPLSEGIETELRALVAAGAKETWTSLYGEIGKGSEISVALMAKAMKDILAATELVHSQYYRNESIIDVIAEAIASSSTETSLSRT